ncbi:hypothetical protein EVAR_86391_1 [Eumeta japonica]|uniref:Uncharacterized protein n=1 Tax=Eumeta variegata TaxID=151549 RepID=A0A4C1WAD2_EUMVA|nr:hypothetical protein EVAR_86391_1 [Eumeta japonica]
MTQVKADSRASGEGDIKRLRSVGPEKVLNLAHLSAALRALGLKGAVYYRGRSGGGRVPRLHLYCDAKESPYIAPSEDRAITKIVRPAGPHLPEIIFQAIIGNKQPAPAPPPGAGRT